MLCVPNPRHGGGRFLVVTFHYVGMPTTPFPGIHGPSADAFRRIVEKLTAEWTVVSLADVRYRHADGRGLPERCCLLTFDDGLRCQYETALPILEDLGLPAAFFVLGAPYAAGTAATVHKLHYVRAHAGDAAVAQAVAEDPSGMSGIESVDDAVAAQHYRYDPPVTARLKYFLNYLAAEDVTINATRRLLDRMGIPENRFIDDLYMDRSMIRHLGTAGFLGSHAFSHRPLSRMEPSAILGELSGARRILEDISGVAVDCLSYPLGNPHAVDRAVAEIAGDAGYRLGFTMERAINRSLADPLLLARLDVADLGNPEVFGPRARYLVEH